MSGLALFSESARIVAKQRHARPAPRAEVRRRPDPEPTTTFVVKPVQGTDGEAVQKLLRDIGRASQEVGRPAPRVEPDKQAGVYKLIVAEISSTGAWQRLRQAPLLKGAQINGAFVCD